MSRYGRIYGFVFAMSFCLASLTACGETTEQASGEGETSIGASTDDVSISSEDDAEQDEQAVPDMSELKELQVGDKAPDFTAKLVDGSEFKMSDHDNEVVLINFFASWCGPCMREMPAFEKLKNDNIPNLSILCVNCAEDKATVDALVKDEGYTFPVAYDEDWSIEAKYPTEGIPYTLVIKNGVIEKIFMGAEDADKQYAEYKGAIDECMK